MEQISIGELRKSFHDVLLLVSNGKQRLVVKDEGSERVGIVPLEDLALLESLDNGHSPVLERSAVATIKRHLNEDLQRVAAGSERIVVHEHEQDMVAVVPERDVRFLEGLDQRLDLEAAKRLLEEKLLEDQHDDDDEHDD